VTVTVNGQRRELPDEATVAEAVAALTGAAGGASGAGAGVAVAVNDMVVPRGAWEPTRLAEADRVEVLTAVQGG
jgi:sulfur carrier protein